AKLVSFTDIEWTTEWEDKARIEWHKSKMASKVERVEKQIVELGIKRGIVPHEDGEIT
ncbi:unnamed protein product, partial [Laminaria digitata]